MYSVGCSNSVMLLMSCTLPSNRSFPWIALPHGHLLPCGEVGTFTAERVSWLESSLFQTAIESAVLPPPPNHSLFPLQNQGIKLHLPCMSAFSACSDSCHGSPLNALLQAKYDGYPQMGSWMTWFPDASLFLFLVSRSTLTY